jgi:hypothetical protein
VFARFTERAITIGTYDLNGFQHGARPRSVRILLSYRLRLLRRFVNSTTRRTCWLTKRDIYTAHVSIFVSFQGKQDILPYDDDVFMGLGSYPDHHHMCAVPVSDTDNLRDGLAVYLFEYSPLSSYWDTSVKKQCILINPYLYSSGAINSFTDVIVYLWPSRTLFALQLPLLRRLGLLATFSMGLM